MLEETTVDDTTTGLEPETELAESSSDQQTDELEETPADATERPSRKSGPIPLEDHERILRGTRSEYEERYGWARGLDRGRVEKAIRIADMLDSNPDQVLRWLSSQTGGEELPKPNLQTEDGRLLYDAEQAQKLVDFHLEKIRREISERLDPIESRGRETAIHRMVSSQVDEAMGWSGFKENLDQIIEAITAAQEAGRPMSLERAYINTVVPNLHKSARRGVVNEMRNKSGASDDNRPGRQPSRAAVKDSDRPLHELIGEEVAARRK